jgi:hypothetical protein
MENLYTPDCIRTVSGKYVNVFDPDPDTFLIGDIAHALSMQTRFGGHLPKFYSVAQHSVQCSFRVVGVENRLTALMHDCSEAYLMDIPSPIKKKLNNYKEIEHGLMLASSKKFSFKYPLPDEVKKIDQDVLQVEWSGLMLQQHTIISPVSNEAAYNQFLSCFFRYSHPSHP